MAAIPRVAVAGGGPARFELDHLPGRRVGKGLLGVESLEVGLLPGSGPDMDAAIRRDLGGVLLCKRNTGAVGGARVALEIDEMRLREGDPL